MVLCLDFFILRITFFRFILVIVDCIRGTLSIRLVITIHCMVAANLFIYSPIDGHLACFHEKTKKLKATTINSEGISMKM